jgi:hypothetical protein
MRAAFARSDLASPERMAPRVASRALRRVMGASSRVLLSLATMRSNGPPGEPDLEQRFDELVSGARRDAPRSGQCPRAFERLPDRMDATVLVIPAVVVDRGPRDVPKSELSIA